MLEILLLRYMWERIGGIADKKNYSPLVFQLPLILLWFVGEITGFILAGGGADGDTFKSLCGPYILAVMGAFAAAGLVFLIAILLPGLDGEQRYDRAGNPIYGRRARRDFDEEERRRRKKEREEEEGRRRRRQIQREKELGVERLDVLDDADRPRRRGEERVERLEEVDDDRPRRRRDDDDDDDRDRRRRR